MNVEQILEIFYLWPIFEVEAFFSVYTLSVFKSKHAQTTGTSVTSSEGIYIFFQTLETM